VTRLAQLWRAMEPEQRLATVAALAMLVTMFLPWYSLQSLNRRSGAIYSHSISAFGDVSFVEAAIFLVAVAVVAMLLARADGRAFHLPGGDGTVVIAAGAWAALLIFYRVFSRPSGDGYPVGIEWGFFLAFVAAGALAYAGWRMRARERPEPPLRRARRERRHPYVEPEPEPAGATRTAAAGRRATAARDGADRATAHPSAPSTLAPRAAFLRGSPGPPRVGAPRRREAVCARRLSLPGR
jgi:hypothetical protein